MSGKSLRSERIGVVHTARMLNVSVAELKDAVRLDALLRGVKPPQPIMRSAGRSRAEWIFMLGDVMDAQERMKGA